MKTRTPALVSNNGLQMMSKSDWADAFVYLYLETHPGATTQQAEQNAMERAKTVKSAQHRMAQRAVANG